MKALSNYHCLGESVLGLLNPVYKTYTKWMLEKHISLSCAGLRRETDTLI